jgi:2-polyprenyl-6-methoxyphenol hydroxylase-like FAD-dependent oxidoreductase
MDLKGKKIAVVGSGITGLGSAWILHRLSPFSNDNQLLEKRLIDKKDIKCTESLDTRNDYFS